MIQTLHSPSIREGRNVLKITIVVLEEVRLEINFFKPIVAIPRHVSKR